jgi:hypothetical protein
MNLLTLLILRPKILKFFAVVILYLAVGSCFVHSWLGSCGL